MYDRNLGVLICLIFVQLFVGYNAQTRPHIIFIIADDMGWNDVGFTGRSDLQTPNIDALAFNGRIMTQHYAMPTCTPSRSALLTGKYPISLGMQGYPLSPDEPRGLPIDQKLLPQYMKDLGYQTHLVGKWHLGYHEWRYTPTARGFDTHYGYLNGEVGYFNHTTTSSADGLTGYDFWRNGEPDYEANGKYMTDLLTDEAVQLINNAGAGKPPLFLMLAHLAPHANSIENPLQYPEIDLAKFEYVPHLQRRKYAAMVWNLDKSVGKVVKALADKNMLRNSIIVFISDNGAPTINDEYANYGSNYPMQGIKYSVEQGGIHTLGAIWTPQLHGLGRGRIGVTKQLFHMTDWLPTLYTAAGGDMSEMSGMDGVNQWEALNRPLTGQTDIDEFSVRNEVLININEVSGQVALIYENFKLIKGSPNPDHDGEFPAFSDDQFKYKPSDVLNSDVNVVFRNLFKNTVRVPDIMNMRTNITMQCYPPSETAPDAVPCDLDREFCLFDIRNDPCERINLAAKYPDMLKKLEAKLETYYSLLKNQLTSIREPEAANPAKFNNTWVCWVSGMPNTLIPFSTTPAPDYEREGVSITNSTTPGTTVTTEVSSSVTTKSTLGFTIKPTPSSSDSIKNKFTSHLVVFIIFLCMNKLFNF